MQNSTVAFLDLHSFPFPSCHADQSVVSAFSGEIVINNRVKDKTVISERIRGPWNLRRQSEGNCKTCWPTNWFPLLLGLEPVAQLQLSTSSGLSYPITKLWATVSTPNVFQNLPLRLQVYSPAFELETNIFANLGIKKFIFFDFVHLALAPVEGCPPGGRLWLYVGSFIVSRGIFSRPKFDSIQISESGIYQFATKNIWNCKSGTFFFSIHYNAMV